MRLILLTFFLNMALFGVDISQNATYEESNISAMQSSKQVFGYNLFNGSFSHSTQHRFNPNYLINIGDAIRINLWGAFDLNATLHVDSQGNIFIPKVGTVKLLGVKNENLSQLIQTRIKEVYKSNVYVYADLLNYQPVSIFVTGSVNKPGLYEGLSSDSVVQFIDKARGIDATYGSYRNIKILRNNALVKTVDLYNFLVTGKVELFQFQNGDVIVISPIKNYIEILGDVKRPYRYELKEATVSLQEVVTAVLPNPTASNVIVTSFDDRNNKHVALFKISENLALRIKAGEEVEFVPDHHADTITVSIEGEHHSLHSMVVKRGTTLQKVLEKITYTPFSQKEAMQLFRKSVAKTQKSLIEASLKDLESQALTTGSYTAEEAVIRQQEAKLILNFVERARKVEPKGQVVINKESNLSRIVLEDEDTIYIPKRSRMITIQGEVMLPGAQTYVKALSFEDYIASCGGYNFRANTENVLIIRQNGKVVSVDDDSWFGSNAPELYPGDSILVLGKVDSKVLQVVKDITQIVYQLAIGAAVVLRTY